MVRFIVKDVRAAVRCVSSFSVRRAMLSGAARTANASKDSANEKDKPSEDAASSGSTPIASPVKPYPAAPPPPAPRYKLVAITKPSSPLPKKSRAQATPTPRLGKDFLKAVPSKSQSSTTTHIASRFREPFPSSYQGVSAFENWITTIDEMLPKQSTQSPQPSKEQGASSRSANEMTLPSETIGSRFQELRDFYVANCPEGSRKTWHLRIEEVKGAKSAFIIYLVHRSKYQVALPFEILANGYHFPSDIFYFTGRDNHSDMQWIRNSLCIRELARRQRTPELSVYLRSSTPQLIVNAVQVYFPGCRVVGRSLGKLSSSRPSSDKTVKETSAAALRARNRTGMGMVTRITIKPHTNAFFEAHVRKVKKLEAPNVKYHSKTMDSAACQLLADVILHCKTAK